MVGKRKMEEAGLVSASSLPEFWNVSPIDRLGMSHASIQESAQLCLWPPFLDRPVCLSICLEVIPDSLTPPLMEEPMP